MKAQLFLITIIRYKFYWDNGDKETVYTWCIKFHTSRLIPDCIYYYKSSCKKTALSLIKRLGIEITSTLTQTDDLTKEKED